MNREYCIFKADKACNSCGECERCDLNANVKCNNCGKCLEMEGYDIKAIKIDEIIEDKNEGEEYKLELDKASKNHEYDNHYQSNNMKDNENNTIEIDINSEDEQKYDYDDYCEDDTNMDNDSDISDTDEDVEYIDDIEGLSELLEDKDKLKENALEEFPGFIRLIKANKK